MLGTAGEVRKNLQFFFQKTFSCGFLHMDTRVLADQHRFAYLSSVQTLDAV